MTVSMTLFIVVAASTPSAHFANPCINQQVVQQNTSNANASYEVLVSATTVATDAATTQHITSTASQNEPVASFSASSTSSRTTSDNKYDTTTHTASSTVLLDFLFTVTDVIVSTTRPSAEPSISPVTEPTPSHLASSVGDDDVSNVAMTTKSLISTLSTEIVNASITESGIDDTAHSSTSVSSKRQRRLRRSGHEFYPNSDESSDHSEKTSANHDESNESLVLQWTAVAVLVLYVTGYELGFGTGTSY